MQKAPFNDDTLYEGIYELYEGAPFNDDTLYEGISELYEETRFNDDTLYEGIIELYDETATASEYIQYQVSSFDSDDKDDDDDYSEEYSSPYNDDSIYEGIWEMYQVDSAYRDFIKYIYEHEEYITNVEEIRGSIAWHTISSQIRSICSAQDLVREDLDIDKLMGIVVDSYYKPRDILKALGDREYGWRMNEVEELL